MRKPTLRIAMQVFGSFPFALVSCGRHDFVRGLALLDRLSVECSGNRADDALLENSEWLCLAALVTGSQSARVRLLVLGVRIAEPSPAPRAVHRRLIAHGLIVRQDCLAYTPTAPFYAHRCACPSLRDNFRIPDHSMRIGGYW